jgi:hypothetical protein
VVSQTVIILDEFRAAVKRAWSSLLRPTKVSASTVVGSNVNSCTR